jgi:hypothetical protein
MILGNYSKAKISTTCKDNANPIKSRALSRVRFPVVFLQLLAFDCFKIFLKSKHRKLKLLMRGGSASSIHWFIGIVLYIFLCFKIIFKKL